MQNAPTRTLNRTTLMFPLALVLFELATYIGNDLIQPAMLPITQYFGVSTTLAPSAMSLYLLGGACVAWLFGPLSDRYGRKKVLLAGVLFFTISCVLILFTQNMSQFLILRFLQGSGLTIVSAVGYAAVQESFEEKDAVKVMALMTNLSLLAPLLGPVLGAFLISHISWHWGFVFIALISLISWFGLKQAMPEIKPTVHEQKTLPELFKGFKAVYSDRHFLSLAVALPLVVLPLMLWIAISPIILVDELKLSSLQYGLFQIPVFAGLILGNIVLIKVVDRYELGKTIFVGFPIMLLGAVIASTALIWPALVIPLLLVGLTLVSFGEGIAVSVVFRSAFASSELPKGTVAASMSMLNMTCFFVGIEVVRILYSHFHMAAYLLMSIVVILIWFTFPRRALIKEMQKRKKQA
ncbi:MFS transporter [Acinetobacter boissieri]|uniref:MFS transporter, DHA1 family, multidrug/chloramphenicol efflux transport protein n=1 Tax=Acinetobacter boissieri TaxID=1219383 RepID=A0A1G6HYY5_9GAMM|nr:MFS transporter [Acinetobacter boissieri]SDB99431.1 MFS transporter, DHA1 family, multidrug/chloramphenicol efflux transport protein [Acinetobacter boissieri]